MRRSVPWIIAGVALTALIVSLFELHQARERYWKFFYFQMTHQRRNEIRTFLNIREALRGLDHPIVVIGDSITELATLPGQIAGHPVVNAGIGGTTINDFEILAPLLLKDSSPSLIAVALGTNDGGGDLLRDYQALLAHLKSFSPRLLAVGVTRHEHSELKNDQIRRAAESQGVPFVEQLLPMGLTLPDGIHLSEAGYRDWTPHLVEAITKAFD